MAVSPEQLRGLFRATLDGLSEMLGLLQQESLALSARDDTALDRIALQKRELTPILDRLAAEQGNCLGLAHAGEGIEPYLARVGAGAAVAEGLRADWRKLLDLLHACKHQNELNGAYIGLLRRHVEQALEILHGPSHSEATYGPDGAKRRAAYSRRSYSA